MTMIKPQLAKDTRGNFALVPDHYVMEPKLDGWRWMVESAVNGLLCYGGRNGAAYPPPPFLAELDLPVGTVLDGELCPIDRTKKSPHVNHLLAHGGAGLCYVVFDLLYHGPANMMSKPLSLRHDVLLDLTLPENVIVSPAFTVEEDLLTDWLAQGFEGCVAKDPDSTYRPGSRTAAWLKVKPQEKNTVDARVVSWEYGKGASNKRRCGALVVQIVDEDIKTPSGARVETTCAYDCTADEARLLVGKHLSLRHHGVFDSGKLRHPIFDSWRPDRDDNVRWRETPAAEKAKTNERTKKMTTNRKPVSPVRDDGGSRRNYGAMVVPKLEQCIDELERCYGEAYDRCVSVGGDPAVDLQRARRALAAKQVAA